MGFIDESPETIGFIGLGIMGRPIATRLIRLGLGPSVWNRTPATADLLRSEGAHVADSVDEVFARSRLVFLMLANGAAVDSVLGRGTDLFAARVRDRTIVALGTTAPQVLAGSRT
ncbi:NAD(P)-binding domain-containing protein [Nocardia sp. NPDC004123]